MAIQRTGATQLDLGIGNGTAREVDPVDFVQKGAALYAQSHAQSYDQSGLDTLQVDPQRGHAQFLAYNKGMQQEPGQSTVDSYGAMREEVHHQHDFLTRPQEKGGLGIRTETVDHDPYPAEPGRTTTQKMAEDVRSNRRIQVMSTATTGGHAFFSNEENDKFRAVHDVFGHLATGRGTSRHGEEAAYLSHAQMFTPRAREALASETRGQNSYLNYNNKGEGFPEQDSRLVGMPQWATERGPLSEPKQKKAKPQGKQGTLF